MVAIGCCCAEKRLGLEHKEAKNVFHTVKINARQKERHLKVQEIQQTKTEYSQILRNLSKKLTYLKNVLSSFKQSIHPSLYSELISRSKSGQAEVIWEYLITEKYQDENGKNRLDKKWFPKTMGTISGLGSWLTGGLDHIRKDLNELYIQLDTIPDKPKLSEDEITASINAFSRLNSFKRIERDLAETTRHQDMFFDPENLKLLPLIIRNNQIRPLILEQVAILSKEQLDKPAKEIMRELEREFISTHKASGMSIAS